MTNFSEIERKIESLKTDVDPSLFHTDRGRYIRQLENEYINSKKILELSKKKLDMVRPKKNLEERLDHFKVKHSEFFDMLHLWHRNRSSYLENAINDYVNDYQLHGFLKSVGKYHPHEKVAQSLGAKNIETYYRVKDFVNHTNMKQLQESDRYTQSTAVQRYMESNKKLSSAIVQASGKYKKQGLLKSLFSGAKKIFRKYLG